MLKKKIFKMITIMVSIMLVFALMGCDEAGGGGTEGGMDIPASRSISKYEAIPNSEIGEEQIKYSFTSDGYDFYYIYLGELKNIPLFFDTAYYHSGMVDYRHTFTETNTDTITISEIITQNSQETINVAETNTVSLTTGAKFSTEISTKAGIGVKGIASAEVATKNAFELSTSLFVSAVEKREVARTTSLINTIQHGTTQTSTTMQAREFNFTKDVKQGFYRWTYFSASDVYLFIVRDSKTGDIFYEFRENVIPDVYFWALDYSETASFRKSDLTTFDIDLELLDNLPVTRVNLDNIGGKYFGEFEDLDYSNILIDTIGSIYIPSNVVKMRIIGQYPNRVFKNTNIIVGNRDTSFTLELVNFGMTAPAETIGINSESSIELIISLEGDNSIIGGIGRPAPTGLNTNGSGRDAVIGGAEAIKSNGNLILTGSGNAHIEGGSGTAGGNGQDHNINGTADTRLSGGDAGRGSDGGVGITATRLSLTAKIGSITIKGGTGGAGGVGGIGRGTDGSGAYRASPGGIGGTGGVGGFGVFLLENFKVDLQTLGNVDIFGGEGGIGGTGGCGGRGYGQQEGRDNDTGGTGGTGGNGGTGGTALYFSNSTNNVSGNLPNSQMIMQGGRGGNGGVGGRGGDARGSNITGLQGRLGAGGSGGNGGNGGVTIRIYRVPTIAIDIRTSFGGSGGLRGANGTSYAGGWFGVSSPNVTTTDGIEGLQGTIIQW